MTAVDAFERMLIEHACAKLVARYAALMDGGDYDGVAALYTEAGAYARPGVPGPPLHGREAILAELRARPARLGRHIFTNVIVEVESAERARGQSRVVLYMGASTDAPAAVERTLIGEFHDLYEKVGEDWLFAERRGSITLKA